MKPPYTTERISEECRELCPRRDEGVHSLECRANADQWDGRSADATNPLAALTKLAEKWEGESLNQWDMAARAKRAQAAELQALLPALQAQWATMQERVKELEAENVKDRKYLCGKEAEEIKKRDEHIRKAIAFELEEWESVRDDFARRCIEMAIREGGIETLALADGKVPGRLSRNVDEILAAVKAQLAQGGK